MNKIITVDGPSGAGKGTLCLWLAQQLNWQLLDSGALYRLVALVAYRQQIKLDDLTALEHAALNLNIEFRQQAHGVGAFLEGQDVSQELRSEKTATIASQVASIPVVRTALLARQRAFASPQGVVADGRDMGTVVFPQAPLKIFLTASANVRAKRRYDQLIQSGASADLNAITQDIKARDARDQNRSTAPLTPAPDALLIDSSTQSIESVCQQAWQQVLKLKLNCL